MVKNTPFLIRNLPKERRIVVREEFAYVDEIITLKKELHFYQSLFKTHYNSAVFNLSVKTINGEKVWVDRINEHLKIHLLDKDEEVEEWLKPVKCER